MPWTYILECRGGAFYVGSTGREIESRVWEHNNDDDMAAAFTRRRRPVRLVYAEWFDAVELAFAREKQLQGWRREKKLALIASRGVDLPGLSQPASGPVTSTGSATSAAAQQPDTSTGPVTSAAVQQPDTSTGPVTSAAVQQPDTSTGPVTSAAAQQPVTSTGSATSAAAE